MSDRLFPPREAYMRRRMADMFFKTNWLALWYEPPGLVSTNPWRHAYVRHHHFVTATMRAFLRMEYARDYPKFGDDLEYVVRQLDLVVTCSHALENADWGT